MRPTQTFRAQHDQLLALAAELSKELDVARLPSRAADARARLSKLAGLLTVHLAMEDRSLYPKLEVHADPRVSAVALRFMEEMGGLKEAFVAYANRWSKTEIEANPEGFVTETRAVLAALGERIERENNDLYVLLDAAA